MVSGERCPGAATILLAAVSMSACICSGASAVKIYQKYFFLDAGCSGYFGHCTPDMKDMFF